MFALLGLALAHPVGGHRVDHALRWEVGPAGSVITYTIDLPHLLQATDEQLTRGLILSRASQTVPLVLVDRRRRELEDGTRVTLHLSAEHLPGDLKLTDGNLPQADARILREVRIHRDLDVLMAPRAVGARTFAARTAELEVQPTRLTHRLERRLAGMSTWRAPEASTPSMVRLPALLVLSGSLALGLWWRRRRAQSS